MGPQGMGPQADTAAEWLLMAALPATPASTGSAAHTRVQVLPRVRLRVAQFLVSHSPHAASAVLALRDCELSVSGTTARGLVAADGSAIRGDMQVPTILTGGGILVPLMTRISNTRRAWPTR